ncbi:MAG: hypothetical protein PVG65_05030 [Candidatus Thorarchaeota archaeon]|jgi:hypothetical protein
MADALKKLKRRIVNYIYSNSCNGFLVVRIADFLKLHAREDDENKHLLEIPEKVRKQYKSPDEPPSM